MYKKKELTIKDRYNMLKKSESQSFDLVGKFEKYPRNIFSKKNTETPSAKIVKYALKNESSAKCIEKDNTMIFVVDPRSTKPEIKRAVTELYGAPIMKVNTLISFKHGYKKAFIRFKNEGDAVEIAGKAGVL